jgi:pimeloyl-ACP methyl ester carboxylesterase
MTTRVMRQDEWARPSTPVRREVLHVRADDEGVAPPVLFVHGFGQSASVYTEHWLEHTADRGFPAYAMSLRGHGRSEADRRARLRDYVHDVTQVAASLPRQAALVGHGAGALVVAMALARYPARAGVLVAPVFGGLGTAFGGFFGRRRASRRVQRQLLRRQNPEEPVGDPPVLVVGGPDDRIVSRSALEQVARRYGGAPLLFPGMGHDLMLDARWREPIDAIVDWLVKSTA